MAISLFAKFFKIKETQSSVESDSAMLALPNGTVVQKLTGEEYVKISTNVFDKVNRDIYSQDETNRRYLQIDGENTATANNFFTKNVDVKQNLSTGSLQVTGTTQAREVSCTDITANNLDLTNRVVVPSVELDTLQGKQIMPFSNRTGTIGSDSRIWSTGYIEEIYGTAQHARYSDLAEKYETDQEYEPGTVLEHGNGVLTKFKGGALAGVISTKPGLKINSEGKGQYVCLKGMVPVKCSGPEIQPGQYCIARDGMVYGVSKQDLTWELSLDMVGVALKKSSNGMVLVKC